jgi:hypothetical protein
LEAASVQHTPDIICVTEYAPKNYVQPVQESELQMDGYDIFTNKDTAKRGVLIYTKSGLSASPSLVSEDCKFEEHCWCEINLGEKEKLLVGCIYRSPNSEASNNAAMLKDLQKICNKSYSHIMICGDFNYPGINWETEQCSNQESRTFLEGTRDSYLHQHVKEPTHCRPGQRANTLDLILTNEEGMIDDVDYSAPIGKSHHSVLTFTLKCSKENPPFKPRPLFEKGDYTNMARELGGIDWKNLLEEKSCEDAWECLHNRIQEAIEKFVPKSKPPGKKTKPKWMTPELQEKIRKKQTAYRKYMNTREGADYQKYSKLRNQVKWLCRKAVRDHEREIARGAKMNTKAVFSYAKKRMKTKSGVADLTRTDGSTATKSAEKAEVLNEFFSSVFTREDKTSIPQAPELTYEEPLLYLTISAEEVVKQLQKQNPNKATGPDNIPPRLLKELAEVLGDPIAMIMNKSIQEGQLPTIWKKAHVVPIFKKGKKNVPGNYRPVSLTSVTCKVMESLVREKLIKHLNKNSLISNSQHGFVGGRSCSTNLLATLDAWTETLEDGGCVDAIYLDFAKAFDTVPHERLLEKLKGMGVQGKVLQWIRSFLSDRVQKVIVEGEESGWRDVVSGIPQGSVLGPMLFICFINDLPEEVTSEVFVFADDTKLFARVPEKAKELQQDLDSLQKWSDKWQLRFNTSKCKVMHLGKQKDPHTYYMERDERPAALETTSVEKDLGVNVDEDLNFEEHVETQTSKATKLLGMIRRTFTHIDDVTLPLLYKAIVRPHLEYCNTVWHPKSKRQAETLEAVQHRATKLVPNLKEKEYEERLRALSLPSLYYRRARGDMIECYKYMSGIYNVSSSFLEVDTGSTRGHSKKLKKKTATKACRCKYFSRRITNAWNSLPEEVVSAPTMNTFKSRLDKAWKEYHYVTNTDWYTIPGKSNNH